MKTKIQGDSSTNLVLSSFKERRTGRSWNTIAGPFNTQNRIDYEEGPSHLPDGSTNWKSCTHSWNLPAQPCDLSGRVWETRGWWDYDATWHYPSNLSYWLDVVRAARRKVKTATDAEMLHEAEYVMEGRLNQTLLPITDLVQLVRKVDGLGSADALMTSLLAPFRAKPKSWSDLVKKVAGADLARKFGIQTLMDTITSSIRIGGVIEKHLRRLERIQNSQQRNFRVTVNDEYKGPTYTRSPFGGYLGQSNVVDATATVGGIASTSIHFRTSVRYDTSDALRTRLVWDALGLSNLFSTAWDLMPLSFVIDWFVRVQEFAARLDSYYFHTVPLERMTELQDVWITRTLKGFVEFSNFTAHDPSGEYTVKASLKNPGTSWKLEGGVFTRNPLNPAATSAWLPGLKVAGTNLTLAQSITGLELMVQRSF